MTILTADDIKAELAAYKLEFVSHAVKDRNYAVYNHDWYLRTFLPWWAAYKFEIGFNYAAEFADCDDFALIFKAELAKSVIRNKWLAQGAGPCISFIVQMFEDFANVKASENALHELNLVRTTAGWFVTEPQNEITVPLAAYPNVDYIYNHTMRL